MLENKHKSFAELVGFPECINRIPSGTQDTHSTTVLALRFKEGIVNLGDRRATSANYIMYDRADKILPLDDYTLIAVAGSFARSVEVARYLRHAFKYYARMQLQDLSLEGKLQEVSRALLANLSLAMDGIGMFLPVVSAYDPSKNTFSIYFFDALGARFENSEFGCAGSGAERIRGVFDFIKRTKGAFEQRPLEDVLTDGLVMLDIASQLDSATGGLERVPPVAKILTSDGIQNIPESDLINAIRSLESSIKK